MRHFEARRISLSLPDAGVVRSRHEIIAVRMKVQAPYALHVSIERRIAVAVVKIPLLDDAILVGRVHIIVAVSEANAFDVRVVAVQRLKEKIAKH